MIHVHNDCASDVKFMTFGYEVGWLAQKPLRDDVYKELVSEKKKRSALVPHALCHVRLIFWGYTRTAQSHRAKICACDSDTSGRLNACCWVALGWHAWGHSDRGADATWRSRWVGAREVTDTE